MLSFQYFKYGSFWMSWGSASHLYWGAMRRGRSERTWVGEGSDGWKGSVGQLRPEACGWKVGEEKAAELV